MPLQEMYDQLAKVRDDQEAAARCGGQEWNGSGAGGGRPRIILVSRRLPYKLQVSARVRLREQRNNTWSRKGVLGVR